ncbi:DUF5996 family protein [Azospirillum canadense]|uniref:DUF5996 family protein n=1 Tax=Azospirillum canadense TaxID=403962 RepID=UPI003872DE4B
MGKYRLARTPWVNHSWHATLYVNGRGLTTGPVPDGPGGVEVAFDLIDQEVVGCATDGRSGRVALGPTTVADFHHPLHGAARVARGHAPAGRTSQRGA